MTAVNDALSTEGHFLRLLHAAVTLLFRISVEYNDFITKWSVYVSEKDSNKKHLIWTKSFLIAFFSCVYSYDSKLYLGRFVLFPGVAKLMLRAVAVRSGLPVTNVHPRAVSNLRHPV